MADNFLSSNWHRVANLRPRLHVHAEVSRHRNRGQVWYAVRNAASGEVHRFSTAVYLFVGMLDGKRTVGECWSLVADQLDDEAPTQDEIIRLLGQLHDADLLQSNDRPDYIELGERRHKRLWTRFWQHVGNPMALRIPLWDPDAFLTRILPYAAPVSGVVAFLVWCAVVFPAIFLAAMHWDELTDNVADRLFATETVLLMALVYPVVKALHEMGHAIVLKANGGAVHEMGVMLLVLLPLPYVDASSSTGFRDKWKRAAVGSAGILVETFVAALAMYTWVLVEPGQVRALAFAVMAVAGISTVLMNANPLLRYDGYFILSDLIGIPNLAGRANQYWGWLVKKFLFGSKTPAPRTARGEVGWFLAYAPLSYIVRLMVMFTIVLAIANRFFVIGVIIAIWSCAVTIAWPILRALGGVVAGPALAEKRFRAVSVTCFGLALLGLLFFAAPMPLHTVGEGIVWLPEESLVRAGGDGYVLRLAAPSGSPVAAGQVLVQSRDPDLESEVGVDSARVEAITAKYVSEQFDDKVQAGITLREVNLERAALARASERLTRLAVASRMSGIFVVPQPDDLPGRYHKRGEVLGYVVPPGMRVVRVLVRQNDVDLVRKRLVGAQVMAAADLGHSYAATLVREVPAASDQLPSKALAIEGGGSQAVDPRDKEQTKTLTKYFQFDLEIPVEAARNAAGGHVWVRFDHGTEPLAWQVWRRARQLFLSRFDA